MGQKFICRGGPPAPAPANPFSGAGHRPARPWIWGGWGVARPANVFLGVVSLPSVKIDIFSSEN